MHKVIQNMLQIYQPFTQIILEVVGLIIMAYGNRVYTDDRYFNCLFLYIYYALPERAFYKTASIMNERQNYVNFIVSLGSLSGIIDLFISSIIIPLRAKQRLFSFWELEVHSLKKLWYKLPCNVDVDAFLHYNLNRYPLIKFQLYN